MEGQGSAECHETGRHGTERTERNGSQVQRAPTKIPTGGAQRRSQSAHQRAEKVLLRELSAAAIAYEGELGLALREKLGSMAARTDPAFGNKLGGDCVHCGQPCFITILVSAAGYQE